MSLGRELTAFPSTVVKVTADDGTVGYGEACTLGSDYLDGTTAASSVLEGGATGGKGQQKQQKNSRQGRRKSSNAR